MSDKAERRNLRKEIGEHAAAAMVECRDEVQKVRVTGLQLVEAVRGCDERTRAAAQRVDAALTLGFDNETTLTKERRERLEVEVKALRALDLVSKTDGRVTTFIDRPFLGRLKWLVLGR